MTAAEQLTRHAHTSPAKSAVIVGERHITYGELNTRSAALAQWLLQMFAPGDRVAVHWPNSIEAVELLFACFKAGIVAVAVNTRLKPDEVSWILTHSGARLCFTEPALAFNPAVVPCELRTTLPDLTAASILPLAQVNPDSPAVILYTSGTTAHPKGVTHSHRSLSLTAETIASEFGKPGDTPLALTSIMHIAALTGVLLSAVCGGETAILLPAFNPADALDTIERNRCTVIASLPPLFQFLAQVQSIAPRDVSSLRKIGAGGDVAGVALKQHCKKIFGVPLDEVYGMTESLPICWSVSGSPDEGIGNPAPGVEVRLIDRAGNLVSEGEIGEIVVRSPLNMLGYWNDSEATTAVMQDGWLRTGDLAARTTGGAYSFKGRLRQIIIRGGSNISPQEVEDALSRHPAVLEAGAVGAPDPAWGEIVVAFIALRPGQAATAEQIESVAREHLADYKMPERMYFLDQLPKGLTGKVDRRMLRERLLAKAGSAAAGQL